jgi:hypothetical protein
LLELTSVSFVAAGVDVFSTVSAFAEMGLAILSLRSLFMELPKIPPKDLRTVDLVDSCTPKTPLELEGDAVLLLNMLPSREVPLVPEVTLCLGLEMRLDACPVDWRDCIVLAGWLILGTVVLIELLKPEETERLVTVGVWVGLTAAAALLGVLLTLDDVLGLDELDRLGAGWLLLLPPPAPSLFLLVLPPPKAVSANSAKVKVSVRPAKAILAVFLYFVAHMAGLLSICGSCPT